MHKLRELLKDNVLLSESGRHHASSKKKEVVKEQKEKN